MKYLYTIKMSFLEGLSFKARIPVIIIEQLIFIAVNYFIWKTVGQNGQVGGFTSKQLITYAVMVWIISAVIDNGIDSRLERYFSKGNIIHNLTRPVQMYLYEVCIELGKSIFWLLFGAIPCLVISSFYISMQYPDTFLDLLIFLFSTLLSFIILTSINYIIALLVFYTESIQGIRMIKHIIIDLGSGLLIPVSLYPSNIQKLVYNLPFRHIYFTPIEIFTKKLLISQEVELLITQLVWVIVLVIICEVATVITKSKVSIQGG